MCSTPAFLPAHFLLYDSLTFLVVIWFKTNNLEKLPINLAEKLPGKFLRLEYPNLILNISRFKDNRWQ